MKLKFEREMMRIKQTLTSLKDHEVLKIAELYGRKVVSDFQHHIKPISFNCFESACSMLGVNVNGYGKTATEALTAGILSLFEVLLAQERNQILLKEVLQSSNIRKNTANFTSETDGLKRHNTQHETFESVKVESLKLKKGISNDYASRNNLRSGGDGSTLHTQYENDRQLHDAQQKIKELQQQLSIALKENKKLKEVLFEQQKESDLTINNSVESPSSFLVDVSNKLKNETTLKDRNRSQSLSQCLQHQQKSHSAHTTQKIKVPKLNLQILPNYHGKSNKSLNQSLLENYEKKLKAET